MIQNIPAGDLKLTLFLLGMAQSAPYYVKSELMKYLTQKIFCNPYVNSFSWNMLLIVQKKCQAFSISFCHFLPHLLLE